MTTAHAGAQTVAPNFQELDDSRVRALAMRVVEGTLLSVAQKDYLHGAGSHAEAPASLAADLGLQGFPTMRDLAAATLAADVDRRAVISTARDIVAGSRIDPELAALFLSKVRRLRGTIPTTIAQALGLSASASWGVVAERLEAILSPKREADR